MQIYSKLKVKTAISDLKNEDGGEITEDKKKAKAFNNFFSSVFTLEDTTRIP